MKLKNILFLFFLATILYSPNIFAKTNLYEGEQLIEVNKVQTLFKFIEGDSNKPLVIFVPGSAHLARIAYGFPGGKEDDFLSYWLHKKGYPFLGVSYPIDNFCYTKIYPSFNIRDWGNQVATLAKIMIDKKHLSNHVVILGWSMGGNIEESVSEAFQKLHVNVDAFIGLSAMTPISYLGQPLKCFTADMLQNKLLNEKPSFNMFAKLLDEQNKYNGHEIIPKNIYLSAFIGNIPVALASEGYYFAENKFEFNIQYSLNDSGVFLFSYTPWIGIINDDLSQIPQLDPDAWNFIRSEMLYAQYITNIDMDSNPKKYATTKLMLAKIPQYLSEKVHGNHLFFVGKKGASDTAQKIELIMQHINVMKQKFVTNYGDKKIM